MMLWSSDMILNSSKLLGYKQGVQRWKFTFAIDFLKVSCVFEFISVNPHQDLSWGQWPLIALKFSSVTHSFPTLCNPMDSSMPGFPVHHQLLELAQACPSSQWCHLTISSSVIPFFSCLQSFPASGSFPVSQLFASGDQSIGVSASASVLSMNTQDWSPLELTGWISLQSKGLSRVFSNTTVQKHQFIGAQLAL